MLKIGLGCWGWCSGDAPDTGDPKLLHPRSVVTWAGPLLVCHLKRSVATCVSWPCQEPGPYLVPLSNPDPISQHPAS